MPPFLRLRGLGLLLGAGLVLGAVGPAAAESGLPPARRLQLVPPGELRVLREAEWAARLVEALDLQGQLPERAEAADFFALLCPDPTSRRGTHAASPVRLPPLQESASAQGGSWSTAGLSPGRYRLAVHGKGAGVWHHAEAPLGVIAPDTLAFDVGETPLQVGARPAHVSAQLADGARVERVEAVPAAAGCIAPEGGWRADRALTFGTKARTMVQALDGLARLPHQGEPLLVEAERFRLAAGQGGSTHRRLAVPASAGVWIQAVGSFAEFVHAFEVEESGLYSVLARVHGAGRQIWSLDDTWHAAVVAGEEAPRFGWSAFTTVWLEPGTHTLRARLPRGAGVDVVQVVRRQTDDAAHLDALGSLGLREGPPGERVDEVAARRNLEALVDLLRARTDPASGLASVEAELEDFYRRPLSPILPGDL